MTRYKNIVTLLAVALMLLTTAAKATAQSITAYTGVPFTFEVNIPDVTEENITWEIYNDFAAINLAVIPGNCPAADGYFVGGDNTGSSVDIIWETPGTYLVKVKAVNSCPTDNMKFYLVTVLQSLPVATIIEPGVICEGEPAVLVVELTGDAPWSLVLFDGVNYVTYDNILTSPFTIIINPGPATNTSYTITQVSNIDGINDEPSNTVSLIVNPRPVNTHIYQYTP